MSGPTGGAVEFPAVEARVETRGCEFGFRASIMKPVFMVRPGIPSALALALADELLESVRSRLADESADLNVEAGLLEFAIQAAVALNRATREGL